MLDSSGNGNHGYRPGPQSRVQYTPAAYLGSYALEFNSPADSGTEGGIIIFPHDPSLEPPTGMVESWVSIDALPSAPVLIFAKSTFQFLRREPGPEPPIFYPPVAPCPTGVDCSAGRIIGRSVYRIDVLPDGRIKATIVFPLRQRRTEGLSESPGDHQPAGLPGPVLGARQVGRQAARHPDGRASAAAEDGDGGRPRRRLGARQALRQIAFEYAFLLDLAEATR